MTIERERRVRLPSHMDAVVQHLSRDLRAVALPEPVRELHFMWCCEHPKNAHRATVTGTLICDGCGYAGGDHFYRRLRGFRFDLAWPDDMLAVEVDGGAFSGGRHTRGAGYERDCEKLNEAALLGWKVLRMTTAQVESGAALEWIERAFGRHQ